MTSWWQEFEEGNALPQRASKRWRCTWQHAKAQDLERHATWIKLQVTKWTYDTSTISSNLYIYSWALPACQKSLTLSYKLSEVITVMHIICPLQSQAVDKLSNWSPNQYSDLSQVRTCAVTTLNVPTPWYNWGKVKWLTNWVTGFITSTVISIRSEHVQSHHPIRSDHVGGTLSHAQAFLETNFRGKTNVSGIRGEGVGVVWS